MSLGRRRLTLGLLAAVVVAVAAAAGWWAWTWTTRPVLPAVDLTGADPDVVKAVESAEADVRSAPRSDAAWGSLGVVLFAHDYLPEAATCLAQAGRLNPSYAGWPALQAAAVRWTDPDAAVALYERANEIAGAGSAALEAELAELYLQQGRFGDARRRFERMLQQRPDDARAHLGLARTAAAENDLAGSLDHLNRALTDPHTRKSADLLLAEVQERRGDHAAALQARARAEEAPDDVAWPEEFAENWEAVIVGKQARLRRIQDLERQGRHDDARALAAQVEEQYPDVYWLVEGRIQRAAGRWGKAEEALRKAVELNPDSVDARYDLGDLLLKNGKPREAAECFARVIEREPSDGRAYHQLGLCRKELGDRSAAVEAYRRAVEYAPFRAEVRRDLAEVLLEEGRTQEAVDQLHEALELQPDDEKAKELLRKASK